MHARSVELYPPLVTGAVLDAYAQYLVSRMDASSTDDGICQDSSPNSQEVPRSLEAALAPLEVLYGKTALSAIGIVLHGAEPVIRYVEEISAEVAQERERGDRSEVDEEEEFTSNDSDADTLTRAALSAGRPIIAEDPSSTLRLARQDLVEHEKARATTTAPVMLSQQAEQRGRCLYCVGEHVLFSPYYCPCSAYAYQSIQRQEVWCCKHLLALQLALRVEATGLPQETLRVRVVPAAEYTKLLLRAL
ncbi:hypothetical protein ABL78_0341 [Leptomonas seymouri]|uniref:SWIM-type domain-containing protein n=1 Tax=Leptomonas seymouri TaxID=5684 RepID=A0A0N1I274_LEPSE|nr:hypothetical protein ABL78_0341 [Leptomonas seymouri]|eukprot:KPI90581.1 hypothetical protein ABL78_0341 [Leptomonas seymouri]